MSRIKKKVLFLSGTRADFGKVSPLICALEAHEDFEPFVFVTGMHLQKLYGFTLIEIERFKFRNVHTFENHTDETTMDLTLAKTIEGLSNFCKRIQPDLIVVHGDRVETLAGAIVGSLNNILVAHVEGGELSGTVDELIRHSVSKLSHIHFVANPEAAKRLKQMGEVESTIFIIGSPDIDIMSSQTLPSLQTVRDYYEIHFANYAIAMFHPVTTEAHSIAEYADCFVNALLEDDNNYVVIYPNNDMGSQRIIDSFKPFQQSPRFKVFPSVRFEYFLTLLKNSKFIIGNSSAGIREAPHYGIPTINIGSRQQNRSINANIINVDYSQSSIVQAIRSLSGHARHAAICNFGKGNSVELFVTIMASPEIWGINHQKQFETR